MGGFVGPYLIGGIKERTGEVAAVVIVLGLRAAQPRIEGALDAG